MREKFKGLAEPGEPPKPPVQSGLGGFWPLMAVQVWFRA